MTDTESYGARLLRGVFLGGLFAVLGLVALVSLLISVAKDNGPDYLFAGLSGLAAICLSLATLWATGLWGSWGLAIFFALAPVVILIDFSINPYFPLGAVLAASLLHKMLRSPKPRP